MKGASSSPGPASSPAPMRPPYPAHSGGGLDPPQASMQVLTLQPSWFKEAFLGGGGWSCPFGELGVLGHRLHPYPC